MRVLFNCINFGYKSILKTEFLNGNIKLKKDITGRPIDKNNVTLDHTIPRHRGGKSKLSNYSLMSDVSNHKRGIESLRGKIDLPSFVDYLIVMMNTKTDLLDGIEYLKKWLPNLRKEI